MQSWVSLLLRLRSIINTQIVEPPTYVCNSMISAGHPAEQPPLYHVANIRKQQTNAGVPLPPSPCEAVWTQTRRRKTAQCPPLSLENKTSRSFKRKDRVATETQPATPPPPTVLPNQRHQGKSPFQHESTRLPASRPQPYIVHRQFGATVFALRCVRPSSGLLLCDVV